MEELVGVNDESRDGLYPYDYYWDIGQQDLNYKSPTKRSFLNECISQIYIINDIPMPMISIPAEYNKIVIWSKLDRLIKQPKLTPYQSLVKRVKRRLFWEPKMRQRKCQKPQLNCSKLSECMDFKTSRYLLGIRKIPRNYLKQAKQNIQNDLCQKLKRKLTDQDYANIQAKRSVFFNTNEDACRYHNNMPRHHPYHRNQSMEEQRRSHRDREAYRPSRRAAKYKEMLIEQQYRERSMATERVLESSIRSILYMKALMGLMVSQQDDRNLYI